jgi:hypothetical protein
MAGDETNAALKQRLLDMANDYDTRSARKTVLHAPHRVRRAKDRPTA